MNKTSCIFCNTDNILLSDLIYFDLDSSEDKMNSNTLDIDNNLIDLRLIIKPCN